MFKIKKKTEANATHIIFGNSEYLKFKVINNNLSAYNKTAYISCAVYFIYWIVASVKAPARLLTILSKTLLKVLKGYYKLSVTCSTGWYNRWLVVQWIGDVS